jgi:hypothetical protein
VHDDVGAKASHLEFAAQMADQIEQCIIERHLRQQLLRCG